MITLLNKFLFCSIGSFYIAMWRDIFVGMSTNVRVLDYRSVLTISTSCKASVISSCRFLPGSGELSICYSSLNPTLSSGLSKIDEAIRWWRISLLPHRCRWQWKDKNWCPLWRLCPDQWQVWSSCHSLGVVSRSNCSPVREYCRRLQREEMRMKSTTEAKTCSSSF